MSSDYFSMEQSMPKSLNISVTQQHPHPITMSVPKHHTHKFYNLKELHSTSIDTIQQFQSLISDDYLLLDLRPFSSYNSSRIFNSLNVCVPSTLLKRNSFTIPNIIKTMIDIQQPIIEKKLQNPNINIILYDSNSTLIHSSFQLYQLIQKFKEFKNIYFINGGFNLFKNSNEFIISEKVLHKQKAPNFSEFILPSNDNTYSFMLNVKKNQRTPKLSENKRLAVPSFKNTRNLPNWLECYTLKDSINLITKNFINIEKTENFRIKRTVDPDQKITTPSIEIPKTPHGNYLLNGSENGFKNRYSNVLPYEHSRVKLLPSPEVESNNDDYFNANFISVPELNPSVQYIATQAPLPSTIDDFYKVIFENNVKLIISLTKLTENGIKKSDIYWENNSNIKLIKEIIDFKNIKNLIYREIEINRKGEKRIIKQLNYLDWLDNSVIANYKELIKMIEIKDELILDSKSPVLVHCSAGCGRTGTFITLDLIIESFKKYQSNSNDVDVFKTDKDLIYLTVQKLRKQRISMVQSLDQFILCYEVLLFYFHDLGY